MSDPRVTLLLALADDELVIGHRHAQWTGVAPHLEEDLAFSSIAQDEMGHAVVWYRITAELIGKDGITALAPEAPDGGDPVDTLGLGRQPHAYRHAILCERPNLDWGYTVARQYLYDTAEDVRLQALAGSSWQDVAEATGALRREERYHLLHARTWLDRLARGPFDARRKITAGLIAAFGEALGLFEPLPGEDDLVAGGVLPTSHAELLQRWLDTVAADLSAVGLERVVEEGTTGPEGEFVPTSQGEFVTEQAAALSAPHVERDGDRWVPVGRFSGQGGRHGRHSDDFAELWEEMTGTYRAHPGARW